MAKVPQDVKFQSETYKRIGSWRQAIRRFTDALTLPPPLVLLLLCLICALVLLPPSLSLAHLLPSLALQCNKRTAWAQDGTVVQISLRDRRGRASGHPPFCSQCRLLPGSHGGRLSKLSVYEHKRRLSFFNYRHDCRRGIHYLLCKHSAPLKLLPWSLSETRFVIV